MPASYLDRILAFHRARAASDDRDVGALARKAGEQSGTARPFASAVRGASRGAGPAIIAEIKRRSPSKGDLAIDLAPSVVAAEYESGGAAALSVLTDGEHFAGSAEDLAAARAATSIPVLRKDFTVCEADIYDSVLMGADAVLLIARALGDEELARYLGICDELGLAAVVEVHDRAESERALAAGAAIIGVNQRDLFTFEVDTERAVALARSLEGSGVVKIAESGIRTSKDVAVLGEAGYDAVLVGESLVRSTDRVAAVAALVPGESD